jgi:sugar-specific transcriptional regulator TrmB
MDKKEIYMFLEELGLTSAQAVIYLSLLSLPESKVGKLIKETKISSSSVHAALSSLTQKGLVSFITIKNIKHYNATPPQSLKVLIEEEKKKLEKKEERLSSFIERIKSYQEIPSRLQNAEIYEGYQGLRAAFRKLYSKNVRGKKKHCYFYTYDKENVKEVHHFFTQMDTDEEYHKAVPTYGLLSKEYEGLFKSRKSPGVKARFTNFPIPSCLSVYDNTVLISVFSKNKEPIGFYLDSSELAKTFQDLFDKVWEQS